MQIHSQHNHSHVDVVMSGDTHTQLTFNMYTEYFYGENDNNNTTFLKEKINQKFKKHNISKYIHKKLHRRMQESRNYKTTQAQHCVTLQRTGRLQTTHGNYHRKDCKMSKLSSMTSALRVTWSGEPYKQMFVVMDVCVTDIVLLMYITKREIKKSKATAGNMSFLKL